VDMQQARKALRWRWRSGGDSSTGWRGGRERLHRMPEICH
jgi:hypothetical protein